VLSALVGLEREIRQKSAGLRTYTLVGVSAALFMLISKYGFKGRARRYYGCVSFCGCCRWRVNDGADLPLQVRCAVCNGTLGAGFGHRFDRISLIVILAAKFIEGAWLTIVVIPAAVVLLEVVHRYLSLSTVSS
jgi:hypothetical protein